MTTKETIEQRLETILNEMCAVFGRRYSQHLHSAWMRNPVKQHDCTMSELAKVYLQILDEESEMPTPYLFGQYLEAYRSGKTRKVDEKQLANQIIEYDPKKPAIIKSDTQSPCDEETTRKWLDKLGQKVSDEKIGKIQDALQKAEDNHENTEVDMFGGSVERGRA